MSTFEHFINTPLNSTRNLDKSISMIESDMSYKPTDLPIISRHLSESVPPTKHNYEDFVSCSVCTDVYDGGNILKLPKILPCQHTYCVNCINNWMHCSNELGMFNCPQCKFKVEDLKDAAELPTNRMVLALLEKDSLVYQGYACCPGCRQIRNLEVCFECNLPLCVQCIGKHFDAWKTGVNENCIRCEESLESYKQRIDSINPHITHNFEKVQEIKNEIEESFNLLFQRLNTEKEILLKTVNDIKDENAKYIQFKNEIVALIASFKVFRESNENYEKKSMISRIKKIQSNFDQIPKIQQDYSIISSVPFKIVERFDRKQIQDVDCKYSGTLVISAFNLDSNQPIVSIKPHAPTVKNIQTVKLNIPNLEPLKEATNPVRTAPTAPPLSTSALRNSATYPNLNQDLNKLNIKNELENPQAAASLTSWITTSHIKPQSELTITNTPVLMTSFDNIIFCMDNSTSLSIYERNKVELKLKNTAKLSVLNPKGIAANENYFAVCYSGTLKKDQMKGIWKNLSSNGVMLFTRQHHVVCSIHDKIIELKKDSFKQPTDVALTENHLFVCDKELRAIFKYNLKTAAMQKIQFKDAEPYSISANNSTFIVTDMNSTITMFDLETCNQIKSKSLKIIDQISGLFNTVLTEDGLIFVKNSENQLCLLDSNLEHRAFFNEIQAKNLNISFLQQPNQMLIIGCVNSSQQFKLFGYVVWKLPKHSVALNPHYPYQVLKDKLFK